MTVYKSYWGPRLTSLAREFGSRPLTDAERARYQYVYDQFKAEKLRSDHGLH